MTQKTKNSRLSPALEAALIFAKPLSRPAQGLSADNLLATIHRFSPIATADHSGVTIKPL